MIIKEMYLYKIRSIEHVRLNLSENMNVIVGANNSGKSTILNSILRLQTDKKKIIMGGIENIRLNEPYGEFGFKFERHPKWNHLKAKFSRQNNDLQVTKSSVQNNVPHKSSGAHALAIAGSDENSNILHYYTSKRKVADYEYEIGEIHSEVKGNFSNLPAKLDHISGDIFPEYETYKKACKEILGFVITTFPKGKGKSLAYRLDPNTEIEITNMGEGVTQLVGFLVDLCRVKGKIFVIEEPENDLHPKALKALLDLIKKVQKTINFLFLHIPILLLRHLRLLMAHVYFEHLWNFVIRYRPQR